MRLKYVKSRGPEAAQIPLSVTLQVNKVQEIIDIHQPISYTIPTMNIPSVKTWIIKTVDGDTFEILAPTKLLAKLNFRHDYGYGHIIETVSLKRK